MCIVILPLTSCEVIASWSLWDSASSSITWGSWIFKLMIYCKSLWCPWASLIGQLVKNLPAMQETPVWFLGRKSPWRRDRLLTSVFLGFPGGSAGKESTCYVGDLSLIPGLGRFPGEGKGYPLQYSGLENSMDCIVHRVPKSWTLLSDFQFGW